MERTRYWRSVDPTVARSFDAMGGVFQDGRQNILVLRPKKGVPSSVTNRKPRVVYQSADHRRALCESCFRALQAVILANPFFKIKNSNSDCSRFTDARPLKNFDTRSSQCFEGQNLHYNWPGLVMLTRKLHQHSGANIFWLEREQAIHFVDVRSSSTTRFKLCTCRDSL